MKARGKSRLCRDVAPGSGKEKERRALKRRNTEVFISAIQALVVLWGTYPGAMHSRFASCLPWLSYSAPLALRSTSHTCGKNFKRGERICAYNARFNEHAFLLSFATKVNLSDSWARFRLTSRPRSLMRVSDCYISSASIFG